MIYFIPELVTDSVVLALTILRARKVDVQLRNDSGWLWRAILRGNAFYFLIMCLSNIATIIMHFVRWRFLLCMFLVNEMITSWQTVPQAFKEVNAYYGNMLNSVLTARLILDLREAAQVGHGSQSRSSSVPSYERWEMKVLSKVVDDFDEGSRPVPRAGRLP